MNRTLAVCVSLVLLVSLSALAVGQGQGQGGGNSDNAQSQASVENVEPAVTSVIVTTDDDPNQAGAQVDPNAGADRTFDAEFTVDDRNNHQDVSSGSCELRDPSGSLVATLEAQRRGGQGNQGTWAVTGTIAYHDPPGDWNLRCTATDRQMEEQGTEPSPGSAGETSFEVRELAAVTFASSVVDFTGGQAMEPGTTTDPTSISVENVGNVAVDLMASATALAGPEGASIAPDRVRAASSQDMGDSVALGSSQTLDGFDLAPGEGSSKPVWFTLDVPAGDEQFIPPGNYRGEVSLSPVPSGGS